MMKNFLTIWFCLFMLFGAKAQVELGECSQTQNDKAELQVQKALKAINAADYKMAQIYVNNAFQMQENNAHAYYLAGELAIREKNLLKAEANWTKLLATCPEYKGDLYFFLGILYLENGKPVQAEQYLNKFLEQKDRERGYDKDAKAALKEIRTKEELTKKPVPFSPKPVLDVSTVADEYLAIISPDEELCFFTRRQEKADKYSGPAGTKRTVEEFTLAKKINGKFSVGDALRDPFNTKYNEGGATITANNRELYFTVCAIDEKGYQNCDIYYSISDQGLWREIRPLGPHINKPDSWESQPSVSSNADQLYFVSNRKGGKGGLDIYVCYRLPNGDWGEPENLGESVNTSKNEKSPFLHSDSQTLYLASDGHPGLGGYDIFYVKKENGEWQEPQNIGYPINTASDEIGLFVSLNGKKAYFNSNKLRGKGGWDLYEFDLYEAARPKKVVLVKGTLRDENNTVPEDAELEVKNLKTKEITKISVDKETGDYAAVVRVRKDENVIIKVNQKGKAFTSKLITEEEIIAETPVVKADFEISPITVGREYRLNDINFETNSAILSSNAMQIIDEFILFLKDNPTVKVDIQGHTDDVGNDNDNLLLSRSRAQVVYDYLIFNGIQSGRLSHHGYGEERPVSTNSTEEGRALNRRTIFVITAR